jgi:hypothetical protein
MTELREWRKVHNRKRCSLYCPQNMNCGQTNGHANRASRCKKCKQSFGLKSWTKKTLGRPRLRWDADTELNLNRVRHNVVQLTSLSHNYGSLSAISKNLQDAQEEWGISTNCATISFSVEFFTYLLVSLKMKHKTCRSLATITIGMEWTFTSKRRRIYAVINICPISLWNVKHYVS